jgi:hypothetical protein
LIASIVSALALIAKADVPAEHADLDAELKDWRP